MGEKKRTLSDFFFLKALKFNFKFYAYDWESDGSMRDFQFLVPQMYSAAEFCSLPRYKCQLEEGENSHWL